MLSALQVIDVKTCFGYVVSAIPPVSRETGDSFSKTRCRLSNFLEIAIPLPIPVTDTHLTRNTFITLIIAG